MTRKARPSVMDSHVQLTNPDWAPDETGKPRARRWQPTVAEWDHALVALARVSHPGVAWWWGERRDDEGPHALCYVCDQIIVRYVYGGHPTQEASNAVNEHRGTHYREAIKHMDISRG